MSQERKVITIDGLAGSGKTTLARWLAGKLGFLHFNTGLVYRSIGLLCLEAGVNTENEGSVLAALNEHTIELSLHNGSHKIQVLLDGQDVSNKLYRPEVSEATSKASQYPSVRQRLLAMQREAFPGNSLIVEGRDMGTVVFPDADLKFFIEAEEEVRLTRRLSQMCEGKDLSQEKRKALEEKMKIEILERDQRDQKREHSPTVAAPDAIVIDNSHASLTEVLENMYDSVLRMEGESR